MEKPRSAAFLLPAPLRRPPRCCSALPYLRYGSQPARLSPSKWCRRRTGPAHRGPAMPGLAIADHLLARGSLRRRMGPALPAPAMRGRAIAGRMGGLNMCQAGMVPAHRAPAMLVRGIARRGKAATNRGSQSCRASVRRSAKASIRRPMRAIAWALKPRVKKRPCSRNWRGMAPWQRSFAPCGPCRIRVSEKHRASTAQFP